MNRAIALAVLAAVLVVGLVSSAFTVHQTQQVLVTQFGEPVRVIREPGLNWKVPFIQTVISFDRRLLDFDSPALEVVLGSQRRLVVDAFTRYRITDPLRFFQTVGATEAGIRSRLEPSVTSALRGALANETLPAVLSAERARIMSEIRQRVEADTQDLGISVVDVRIRRADLPEQNTQPILTRMQSERERVGREVRAKGAEEAQRIVACGRPRPHRTAGRSAGQGTGPARRGRAAGDHHLRRSFPARPRILPVLAHDAGLARSLLGRRHPDVVEPGFGLLPLFPLHTNAGRRPQRRRWRFAAARAGVAAVGIARPGTRPRPRQQLRQGRVGPAGRKGHPTRSSFEVHAMRTFPVAWLSSRPRCPSFRRRRRPPAQQQQIAPLPAPPAASPPANQGAPQPFRCAIPRRASRPLARQLLPAVVNISTSQAAPARANRPDAPDMPQAPPGSPFEEFFREFFRNRPGPAAGPGARRSAAAAAPPRPVARLGLQSSTRPASW
jgi:membrane protease subunit HflC